MDFAKTMILAERSLYIWSKINENQRKHKVFLLFLETTFEKIVFSLIFQDFSWGGGGRMVGSGPYFLVSLLIF